MSSCRVSIVPVYEKVQLLTSAGLEDDYPSADVYEGRKNGGAGRGLADPPPQIEVLGVAVAVHGLRAAA